MLHPGGAHYRPTGPGPGPCGTPCRSVFKFRRKWNTCRQWMILYIIQFLVVILPLVDGATTPSPNATHISTEQTTPQATTPTKANADTPFNKVAGSVLVCLGIPFVSFVGLKLFVYLFPDCCNKSDFVRIWEGLKEFFVDICCPVRKTNVVAPTIAKGIELFTAQKIHREDGADDDALHDGNGKDFLRMFLTLQKTKSEFRTLWKAAGKGSRRNSDTSVDTLDGQIITTTASVENDDHVVDRFRSASRSPTPPPHIVVIYPDDNATPTPEPCEFKPIRNIEYLDGQDIATTSLSEDNELHSDVDIVTPSAHKGYHKVSTVIDNDVLTDMKSPPLTQQQQNDSAEIETVSSPRSATSGQSVPRHPTKLFARSNTRQSMCVIKIELPERTEPDGMEAPIPEKYEKDDSSFLTVGSTDYRGESDGGEDSHDIGGDLFYVKPERQTNVLMESKPPSGKNNKSNLHINTDHPERTSLVRRGSYGCEAVESLPPVNTPGASNPCITCESSESPESFVQDVASGDEADDDDDDANSYYSISCPSSNASPFTSQLNTPQSSPNKKLKRIRPANRSQDQQNVNNNRKKSVQDVNLRKQIVKQRFQELNATGDDPLLTIQKQDVAIKDNTLSHVGANYVLPQESIDIKEGKLSAQEYKLANEGNRLSSQNVDVKKQMSDYRLPEQNLPLQDPILSVQSVTAIGKGIEIPEQDVNITKQELTTQDYDASKQRTESRNFSTSESVVTAISSRDNLAKESAAKLLNSSGQTERLVTSETAEEENESITNYDIDKTQLKSSPLRAKRKLQTGVYTSPNRRNPPPKSRAYISLPSNGGSKSNFSRTSKSSSQSSIGDQTSKNTSIGDQSGSSASKKPDSIQSSMSKLSTLLKESSPKNSPKKEKGSPVKAVATTALSKKEAHSPKKEATLPVSSTTYKKSMNNASSLYNNRKGNRKVPGRAVAK
ncbi:uncharacterized protein [Amphiura filiformis]|uniref:uncharacterized protein n=1 Tax=Amphiura filiformis TaxID=82378 RepID=UPI003B223F0F